MPSDLHMQSSTWSQYKHHNIAKFLIGCTPNGAISYISPVFVGLISDVELTRKSGFLVTLKDRPDVSNMADRGFTIKDMFKDLKIELNLPPFLRGKQQLSAEQVQEGLKIASVRIHVERAIERLKTFCILSETIPISLACLTNWIAHVAAFYVIFNLLLYLHHKMHQVTMWPNILKDLQRAWVKMKMVMNQILMITTELDVILLKIGFIIKEVHSTGTSSLYKNHDYGPSDHRPMCEWSVRGSTPSPYSTTLGVRVSFRPSTTLRELLVKPKDHVWIEELARIAYEITPSIADQISSRTRAYKSEQIII